MTDHVQTSLHRTLYAVSQRLHLAAHAERAEEQELCQPLPPFPQRESQECSSAPINLPDSLSSARLPADAVWQ